MVNDQRRLISACSFQKLPPILTYLLHMVTPCDCLYRRSHFQILTSTYVHFCKVPYFLIILLSPNFYIALHLSAACVLIPCKNYYMLHRGKRWPNSGVKEVLTETLVVARNQLCPCCHTTALWILPIFSPALWYTETSVCLF